MVRALNETNIQGIATTIPAHLAILGHADFLAARHSTRWVEELLDLTGIAVAADEEVTGPLCPAPEVQVGGRWYPIYQNGTRDEFWTSKPQFQFYPDLLKGGRDISYPAAPEPKPRIQTEPLPVKVDPGRFPDPPSLTARLVRCG